RRHLHPPGLLAQLRAGTAAAALRQRMAGRLLLPLPQLALRPGRPRLPGRAGTFEPRGPAVLFHRRHPRHGRRRSRGGRLMASKFSRTVDGVVTWFNDRTPGLVPAYKKHMSEYYAPKNFNLWYYFGSLAML